MGEAVNQNMENGDEKEFYAAPEVTRIRLFGDEMVCGACKSVMVADNVCKNGVVFINLGKGS